MYVHTDAGRTTSAREQRGQMAPGAADLALPRRQDRLQILRVIILILAVWWLLGRYLVVGVYYTPM